jgi:L-lactate dehydrogenase (cytochrome)
MRMKFEAEDPSEMSKSDQTDVDRSQGAARAISVSVLAFRSLYAQLAVFYQSFIDPGLNWGDLSWFKSITNSEIIHLKI